jgi:response regulator RpfG family c-di-GMP phosphodiesterase
MPPRILFVDDDTLLLKTVERLFKGAFFVSTARSGGEALDLLQDAPPFAVIVVDMRMPGMDGVELLQEVQALSPDTTRIMLTGESDQLAAMEAVNAGSVFRFLTKPCPDSALVSIVQAAVHQYDLVTGSRVLLEQTLSGSVKVLVDLLSVFDPKAFGQAEEMRDLAQEVAQRMGLPCRWDLGLAALLAPVGRMSIPLAIQSKLNWGERLTPVEQQVCRRIPETAARIVGNIPRLQSVARIIRYSAKDYDGGGFPEDGIAFDDIPLESRILRILADFLEGVASRGDRVVVLEQLKLAEGKYDPRVLDALAQVLEGDGVRGAGVPRRVPIPDLKPGMCLQEDLCTPEGALILAAGTRLARVHLERLRSLALIARMADPALVI